MKAFFPLVLVAFVLGAMWCGVSSQERDTAPVEVIRLTDENWEAVAPRGKEVDAIVGDLVLRNRHLVAVIAQPIPTRNANMTVKAVAGGLIDLGALHRTSGPDPLMLSLSKHRPVTLRWRTPDGPSTGSG